MKKLFAIVSNLQTHYHFKLDFQKVDQHTRGTEGNMFNSKGMSRGGNIQRGAQLQNQNYLVQTV